MWTVADRGVGRVFREQGGSAEPVGKRGCPSSSACRDVVSCGSASRTWTTGAGAAASRRGFADDVAERSGVQAPEAGERVAVVVVCTEIPLLVSSDTSPLPILDSTRLLARAAFEVAVGRQPTPT